ncbi:hypothetical protein DFH06DRAFT_975293 [Mycena polygramma]|nr:hypothetical protein DFH06DRAFT_975293 [Mycena polygramma]
MPPAPAVDPNAPPPPPHTHAFQPHAFHGVRVHPTGPSPFAPDAPPPPPQEWAPPPAPGPTLRDRVERREREAGLRCCDASCGVGPSDEDPFVEVSEEAKRVVGLSLLKEVVPEGEGGGEERHACAHTFHSSCVVSAQRARNGWREPVLRESDDAEVEVVCSVCRVEGSVPQAEWLAGCILPLD